MKKVLLFALGVLVSATLVTSCKKENKVTDTPAIETPRTEVPESLVGKWQIGNFDMNAFWSYNGTRQQNAGTDAVMYAINKDGSAEQFIYFDFTDGTNRQVLAYRKGTVTYNDATGSWKFCSSKGSFRAFVNGNKTEGTYGEVDLYPNYTPQYENITFEKAAQTTYMVCTNVRNEQLDFRKMK